MQREALVAGLIFLLGSKVRTAFITEDLVSIGTIGLMKAVRAFDPNKNIRLQLAPFSYH